MERIFFFEQTSRQREEMSIALAEIVAEQQKAVLTNFMSTENMLHYKHGRSWSHPANNFSVPGEMETISAEFDVSFQRLIDGDLDILSESIRSVAKQLNDAVVGRLYETIHEACEKSGNVVKNPNLEESFLEALEKMEFSVDADGNVQLPQFHMGEDQLEKMRNPSEEFLEKIREIKKNKSERALLKEAERKAKYKTAHG